MCTGGGAVNNPASTLATLIYASIGVTVSDLELRRLIKHRWDEIKPLAHLIHDQECPSLEKRVQDAVARFNALSPDDKRRMREAQKRSWVVGETMLAHPQMPREEAERLYDKVIEG